jgi:hypothetical protein
MRNTKTGKWELLAGEILTWHSAIIEFVVSNVRQMRGLYLGNLLSYQSLHDKWLKNTGI